MLMQLSGPGAGRGAPFLRAMSVWLAGWLRNTWRLSMAVAVAVQVEDIIDTGNTLHKLVAVMQGAGAASVRVGGWVGAGGGGGGWAGRGGT